jgi:hypothetical protein
MTTKRNNGKRDENAGRGRGENEKVKDEMRWQIKEKV